MRTEKEIEDRIKGLKKDKMSIAGTHTGWLVSELYNTMNKIRVADLEWVLGK